MPVTKTRVCLDDQGNVAMIVFPDWDEQLADPAFSPDGLTAIDLPKDGYGECNSHMDLLILLQNHVPGNKFGLRKAIAAKLKKLNESAAVEQANVSASAAFGVIEAQSEALDGP